MENKLREIKEMFSKGTWEEDGEIHNMFFILEEDWEELETLINKHYVRVGKCIEVMRSGELAGSYAEGCRCPDCNIRNQEIKELLKTNTDKEGK